MKWPTLIADLDESKERSRLRRRIQRLLDKWQPILGVTLEDWDLRKMKLYWGSSRRAGCDTIACRPGHITFNTELAKLPPRYVEYIVVHELVDLIQRHHNESFIALLDRHLPHWRHHRKILNEAPLGHADWTY